MDWRKHIAADPERCHGRACIKGTRVFVSVILDNLAAGESEETILRNYPSLSPDAIDKHVHHKTHFPVGRAPV
jgi:uncharacterized protein (DUF433 family)